MFYDLAASTWGSEETAAVNRLFEAGRFTMGDEVRRFEEAFARRFGVKHAAMVNSGSSANLAAVAALVHRRRDPLRPGDEVIVPAVSWATTYHPLQQYGLRLRFVDIDLHTLNLDVSQLEAALTPRTRMVVAVSILGNPAPLDVVRRLCDTHRLIFFEDNCESLGASLDGRPCGTFGDLGTFSTFYSHHLSTIEGGLVVTNDTEIDHLVRVIRNHGWTRDLPADSVLRMPAAAGDGHAESVDAFEGQYRFIMPGYNLRPLELSGAVGLEQLRKLDAMLEARRANAALFVRLFADDDRFIIQREHGRSSWFSFTIILDPALDAGRRQVVQALAEADIGYRMITGGCFLRHEAIRFFDHDTAGDIVNAHIAHDRGFFVGNHPHDLTPQITRLRDVLDQAAGASRPSGGARRR